MMSKKPQGIDTDKIIAKWEDWDEDQIPVDDITYLPGYADKMFCDNCGNAFYPTYKVTKHFPPKTFAAFCSEECQAQYHFTRTLKAMVKERPDEHGKS